MISESIVGVLLKMLIKDRVKMRSMLALLSDWVDRMHAKYSEQKEDEDIFERIRRRKEDKIKMD